MRIRISDPGLLADLAAYLQSAGCVVRDLGDAELEASVPTAVDERQARMEMGVYLTAWRVGHEGVSAEIVD